MEKVMVLLRRAQADEQWCRRLRTSVTSALSALELPGLTVNVRDDAVRASLMTLTTLDPPVVAVVSIWTQQYYGTAMASAIDLLSAECDCLAAYLVTESVPMAAPDGPPSARTPGLANVALLRRPADLDQSTWLARWHLDHTPVAIATQATFGYTQNTVVRALTDGAPRIDAIVEELFPIEAVSDLYAFFGAGDDADLADRMGRMAASVARFGADRDIDTVPTSRYPMWGPAPTLAT
ncbi:EthD domain-containing protein [Mycolicibacterium sp. 120266]|uniref:EthD domain-containing protein n=1 Tax=Mycolicibacterium sp. 120266 TaxID=3090601 RepID=UPI00299ED7B9|nr:EthD domain-containing protein [Mycolicibacterium sp. 120266]MDX1872374.1 EthD domain-containing protein [Mycolicibacterium sp. 120266]